MGIDLLLEFHVEELRLMGPPPLGPQHGAGNQRIIDHEDDRIERRLEEQRDDRQLEELAPGECRIEAEGRCSPAINVAQTVVTKTNKVRDNALTTFF